MSVDKPISVSESQLATILRAAAPLRQQDVEDYMRMVAEQLRARPMIGDGDVYRAVEAAQRKYFDPPAFGGLTCAPKYGR
jgi:hypothetical protein